MFVAGQGWKSLSLTDGIDYDLQAPCVGVHAGVRRHRTSAGLKGYPVEKDLKWISMGEASTFGDFGAFRNHEWKMHLEQRSDGDGTGMKITWRNGDFGEGDPGDHVVKVDPGVDWKDNEIVPFPA